MLRAHGGERLQDDQIERALNELDPFTRFRSFTRHSSGETVPPIGRQVKRGIQTIDFHVLGARPQSSRRALTDSLYV
jgi:hypothetical protein